jgi:ADP-dependent NAD(P)H-hydrate dehydratase / NAD(P)H-hydrate epimerase
MIKVLNQEWVRRMDDATIRGEPIASADLMERASGIWSRWLLERYPGKRKAAVLCGTGNNGGDGLAIARQLQGAGWEIQVLILWLSESGSPDFQTNRQRLERLPVPVADVSSTADMGPCPDKATLIIDALLGSGLNRPLEGLAQEAVAWMNACPGPVLSVDVPSGMFCDGPGSGAVVRATACLGFGAPKLALLLPDSAPFCDDWECAAIGWPHSALDAAPALARIAERSDLAAVLPLRPRFSHKGSWGHVRVCGGRAGMRGAATLAAAAALRAGCGLASINWTGGGPDHLPRWPEIMIAKGPSEGKTREVLLAGPGMGRDEAAREHLERALAEAALPPVLDADALNLLAADPALLQRVPPGAVLTPHPGEFERLFGASKNGFERLERLREAARSLRCTVVLKGAFTVCADPLGELVFNTSGNPGMGTAGSGDVLGGVIASLRAQGLDAPTAAWAGVHWHGLAGDQAASRLGQAGLLASDLIEELPKVRQALNQPNGGATQTDQPA